MPNFTYTREECIQDVSAPGSLDFVEGAVIDVAGKRRGEPETSFHGGRRDDQIGNSRIKTGGRRDWPVATSGVSRRLYQRFAISGHRFRHIQGNNLRMDRTGPTGIRRRGDVCVPGDSERIVFNHRGRRIFGRRSERGSDRDVGRDDEVGDVVFDVERDLFWRARSDSLNRSIQTGRGSRKSSDANDHEHADRNDYGAEKGRLSIFHLFLPPPEKVDSDESL